MIEEYEIISLMQGLPPGFSPTRGRRLHPFRHLSPLEKEATHSTPLVQQNISTGCTLSSW